MIRLLIAGSRSITDANFCLRKLEALCQNQPIECIMSGMASGPDMFGYEFAMNNGIKVIEFPITSEDWKRDGKKAGPLRNVKMLEEGKPTHLIAFNDCRNSPQGSNGTNHMIRISKKAGVKVHEVKYTRSPYGR